MNFLEKILEYIYVPNCGVCGKLGEGYLCKECEKELEKYKLMLIKNRKLFIFKYKDIIRDKIIEYKFEDKAYLYKMFAKIIIKNKKSYNFLKSYDIIIPVPVHIKRKKSRGYNQSELIARELAKELNLKMYNDILIKTTNNKVQSTLNRKQRINNVKNVYKIQNSEKIRNKNIIIFDDIYTTGSTVNECIKELKKASAKRIGVLILAKD